ncbi:unnamed protein product [Aspergillus oryzae]|uniref:Unnamed protein product n=2 Tax=Aspergillus oryzae TaxID=5062 RepID=A0AAN5BSL4_ASPOZ|nr:unnamed protein product [Aspergillus oryzae]GMF94589.1 unnamed protein product [Aspergillus oryzae]GMG22744.1 unnamed protein product [Aspergillus oryzae]GMG44793.1 unnamed protein product [Aspergillus oryzae var. brunneus]
MSSSAWIPAGPSPCSTAHPPWWARCRANVLKAVLESGRGGPDGMSLDELASMVQDTDNTLDYAKKNRIPIAYSKMTMDDVAKYFGIPKMPLPVPFPPGESPARLCGY